MRSSFRNLPLRYGLGAAVRSSPSSKLFGFATARGTRWSGFHSARALGAVQPYLLADIGEGIAQCIELFDIACVSDTRQVSPSAKL